MNLEHSFLFTTFFICLTNSYKANKCKGLTVLELPNLSRAHVGKPVYSILWQPSRAFILTGSYNDVSVRNARWYEFIKFVWCFVCVKNFCIHHNSCLWINDNNVQPSVMTFFVFFNLYQFSIYSYLCKISSIEPRWHCLNNIMILS